MAPTTNSQNGSTPKPAQRRQKGFFVVRGDSHEERRRQIDELIASGKAAPDSLFAQLSRYI
jgi:hypothetical protein